MGRIAFWIALIALIYLAIVLARKRRVRNVSKEGSARKREEERVLPMVQCPVCGTHFPADEAVMGQGVRYCSEKCRSRARARMDAES